VENISTEKKFDKATNMNRVPAVYWNLSTYWKCTGILKVYWNAPEFKKYTEIFTGKNSGSEMYCKVTNLVDSMIIGMTGTYYSLRNTIFFELYKSDTCF